MQIVVNGETRDVEEGMTATQLVEEMGLTGRRMAMEINMEIVPRSTYDSYHFKEGDRVEIVQAIGGG